MPSGGRLAPKRLVGARFRLGEKGYGWLDDLADCPTSPSAIAMTKRSDTPELEQSPRDREVLAEIARLINKRNIAEETAEKGGKMPSLDEPQVEKESVLANLTDDSLPFIEQLLEAIPAGLALCRDDEILAANSAFALAFGYRNGEEIIRVGGLGTLFPGTVTGKEPVPSPSNGSTTLWSAATQSGRRIEMPVSGERIRYADRRYWLLTLHPAQNTPEVPTLSQDHIAVLETVATMHSQGLIQLERDRRILTANAMAARLLGTPEDGLIGQSFDGYFNLADTDTLDGICDRSDDGAEDSGKGRSLCLRLAGEADQALTAKFVVTGRTADRIWVFLDAMPESHAQENGYAPPPDPILGISASNLEILAKISHEVRTPLNSIIGFAELMQEERLGPIGHVKYRGYVDDIHQSGGHALSLINDLLDLTKIETGNFAPNFTAVDTNEVIAECVKLVQPQAQSDRVVLRTSLTPDLPPVLADRRSLIQIALNLLSNAVKFTESGGQVIASTSHEPDGAIKISVRDTGVGMSEADVKQAFKPFRQLDTAPRHRSGTGLGLPLSKALVEANRAAMHIESSPGSGTRIDVVFPADRIA